MNDDKKPSPYEEMPDLEVLSLRKQVRELEAKLAHAQAVLKENDLLDVTAMQVSDEESILIQQIGKLKELSDKNIPFQIEDVKVLEILVKTLLAVRGKAVPVEKPKKKEEKQDIAKLLKMVTEGEK